MDKWHKDISIALVEGFGFIEFISVVEPNYMYKIPSRKHILEVLHGMYKELHCKVMEDLTKAQWVSLTGHLWTSLAMDTYLGITVHFINEDWELMTRVLQTSELKDSHTGENVAVAFLNVTKEWSFQDKLSAIVTDNACNLIRAMDILKWTHLPCAAHTLQITVKAGLSENGISTLVT